MSRYQSYHRWLVLGAGVSGCAAAKFLAARGKLVTICDAQKIDADRKSGLGEFAIEIVEESDHLNLLKDIQAVVSSPGISRKHPLLMAADQAALPIVSDIDLALDEFKGKLIGVTGTNGKSTITAMCSHILKRYGWHAPACGNIGLSPCEVLLHRDSRTVPDALALELSSYQLELSPHLAVDAAIFSSFSPDHITRHGSLEIYFAVKWSLLTNVRADGIAILTADIAMAAQTFQKSLPKNVQKKIIDPPSPTPYEGFRFFLKHDLLNADMALEACHKLTGESPDRLRPLLKDFETLPHRFQLVGTINGFDVFEDSKSTNLATVFCALDNIDSPVILLLGGQSKGEDFSALAKYKHKIKTIFAFGASSAQIYNELKPSIPDIKTKASLQILTDEWIRAKHVVNAPVVFSPGCASFDEFQNYADRGIQFVKWLSPIFD